MKKGFTLVEVIVSIALLSIVLLSLYKILDLTKFNEKTTLSKTENLIKKAEIEKIINEDVYTNGIKEITCTKESCDIILNNDLKRNISITNENKNIVYTDTTNDKVLLNETMEALEFSLNLKSNDNLILLSIENNLDTEYTIDIAYYKTEESDDELVFDN